MQFYCNKVNVRLAEPHTPLITVNAKVRVLSYNKRMNVSPDFTPPLRITAPYFTLGALFYLLSMIMLMRFDATVSVESLLSIGWVHLYLVGFVMMIIFGAMAQLAPVLSEVNHAFVAVFKYIWLFLALGVGCLLIGFWLLPPLLLAGGLLVLCAMLLFTADLIVTLRNPKRKTAVTAAMKHGNYFLLVGVILGITMAMAFAGVVPLDPSLLLKSHIFSLLGGYVMLTIMGISMVLLPMFSTAQRVSDNVFAGSFYTMAAGVTLMVLAAPFSLLWCEYAALVLILISLLLYFYQVYTIAVSRARREEGIWTRSIYFSYLSLLFAFVSLTVFVFTHNETALSLGMWFFLLGFVGFLITGNLYRIVPFLVWFEYYAPYLGERDVPLLHEMVPARIADAQFTFSASGLITGALALLLHNDTLFYAAASLLITGACFLMAALRTIMRIKA